MGMLPGRVMSDFTHPCGFELGCKVKKDKVKRRKQKETEARDESEVGFGRWLGKWWRRRWKW
jgi:hypothetical protein